MRGGSSGAWWTRATKEVAGRIGMPIPAEPEREAMSATITAPARAGSSPVNAVKVTLIAVAIVVLLAASFVIGRVTVGTTTHAPAATPTAPAAPAPSSGATPTTCHMGRPC